MLSNTIVSTTYQGDGSTTSFSILFALITNTQVKVERYDSTTSVTETLVVGTHYTLTGRPATAVVMLSTPTVNQTIRIYRDTPKLQSVDYMDTAAFPIDDHETQMDKTVMMMQELAYAVAAVSVVGGGAFVRLGAQTITASGTITISSAQRILKIISGDSGAQTANATTPITAGSVDGQELRLVGGSDTNTLTILNSGNVSLNGDVVLYANSIIDLCWDSSQSKWLETGRRN